MATDNIIQQHVLKYFYENRKKENIDILVRGDSPIVDLESSQVYSSVEQLRDKGFLDYTATIGGHSDVGITTAGVDRIESGGSVAGNVLLGVMTGEPEAPGANTEANTARGTSGASGGSTVFSSASGDPEELIFANKNIVYSEKLKTPPALNVELISSVFAKHIPSLTKDSGMMVGIFGRWGRGKTYLFHKIIERLQSNSGTQEYIPIIFSAWKYKTANSSWAYLYQTLENEYLRRETGDKCKWLMFFGNLHKRIQLNNARIGPYRFYTLFLPIIASLLFLLFVEKDQLLVQVVSTFGVILALQLYFLFTKYKQSFVSIYEDYVSANSGAEKLLGVQHEMQENICGLLRIWLNTDQKIILFIDDLDRCEISQVLEILDGLRLILDDTNIYKHLIIFVAVDDVIVDCSIRQRYSSDFPEAYRAELCRQYLEKIFIIGIKLMPLSEDECVNIYEVMKEHHFPKNNSDSGAPSLAVASGGTIAVDEESQTPEEGGDDRYFSDAETELLKKAVTQIADATPRKIKLFLFKYALFVELYATLSEEPITPSTCGIIVKMLLGREPEANDEAIELVSGILSAF